MVSEFIALEHNVIGIIGVVMVLSAYFLLQLGRLRQEALSFSMVNLVGSACILVSLYYTPNIPSVVIEIAWLLISLIGVIKVGAKRLGIQLG